MPMDAHFCDSTLLQEHPGSGLDHSMKALGIALVGRFGYRVTRLDSRVEIDSAWGPNILLYALRDLGHQVARPLRIVQIGAHDGSDQDPLQPFLLEQDCDAVLIEPMDHPYKALSERYKDHPRIHTLQAAITDTPGTQEIFYITDAQGNPDLTLFTSFDRNTVAANLRKQQARHTGFANHNIRSQTINARTLKSVLSSHDMIEVDAVIVDAEGYDHRIVTSFLEDGIEPKIIRFEYCNLSRRNFFALRDLLRARDYEITRVGIDIYCQKTGLLR